MSKPPQGEGRQDLKQEVKKGMRMQKANQILQAIRKMGEQDIPLTRVYRNLYCEELYLAAYGKIYRNAGALTPGTDPNDTVDAMSMKRIRQLIEALRYERFEFRPVRGQDIPKKSGGTRPLGMPNFTDKLMQEVLRMVLEAYYEPRFRESSHGFRPQRGCHTALSQLTRRFKGATWFIEGDIRGCFNNINHDVLMSILKRHIHDGRLLNLIEKSLKAGLVKEWYYEKTYSGVPQGGILSPILSNIYLNELDAFVEDVLIPQHTRGKHRATNPAYERLRGVTRRAYKQGDIATAKQLEKQRRAIPTGDTQDPNYRRLKYIRYADDFILGFIGSKVEAQAIKAQLSAFLHDHLKLEMHEEKTLITHARTESATFLGYGLRTSLDNDKQARYQETTTKARNLNGQIRLELPKGYVRAQSKRYMRQGKPIHEAGLLYNSDAHILLTYQQRFRGIADYYKFAVDRHKLSYLKYMMEVALVKTLAHKFKLSAPQVYAKYRSRYTVKGYTYKTLCVAVPTQNGTRYIYWGAIPLRYVSPHSSVPLNDSKPTDMLLHYNDLIARLQANVCELCGSTQDVEVHHIRKLADLKQRWSGRKEKPAWIKAMIRLNRKTLVVCHSCHVDIHAGRPTPNMQNNTSHGEPDELKGSRPVRRGDYGKVS